MTVPTNIYDQLRRDEEDRPTLYWLNGIPHIGVGHNLQTGPPLKQPVRDMILKDDVAAMVGQLEKLPGWNRLSDVRQGVLINLSFRVGFGGLEGFTHMLQAVALGDWLGAAREIRDSLLAHEGDPERTARLAAQMEEDRWY